MNKKAFSANNPLLICSLILVLCATLFVSFKKLYSGDEIASFLFATAHSNEYQDSTILSLQHGQLVSASRLKQFYQTPADFSFSGISKDIGTNDWHPPLYFYLLGKTVQTWGTSVYIGVWLNLGFKLFTLFLLYRIALLFFNNKRYAFITILVWSLSHATNYSMFEARQYDLLCALTLGQLYFFMRWTNGAHWLNLVMAAICTIGGYLTHYTFLPVSAGIVVATVITNYRNPFKQLTGAILTLFVSASAFILIHPYFLQSLGILKNKGLTLTATALMFRLSKSVLSIVDFILPVFELKSQFFAFIGMFNTGGMIILLVMVAVLGILCVFYLRKKIQSNATFSIQPLTTAQWFMGIYMVWIACALFGSYLSFQAPQHAMGRKYLAMFFPFLALWLTYLISLTQTPKQAYSILVILLCLGMIIRTKSEGEYQEKLGEVNELASQQHLIYTTSFDRRGFARLIPDLQNDAGIVYIEKEKLMADTVTLTGKGVLLSATPLDEATLQQQHLLPLLSYSSVDSNSFYFYRVR